MCANTFKFDMETRTQFTLSAAEVRAEKLREEDVYAQAMHKVIKFETWGKALPAR